MRVSFSTNEEEWTPYASEAEYMEQYAQRNWGSPPPDPWQMPEKYPCLGAEVGDFQTRDGDHYRAHKFIYDFTITEE